MSGHPQLPILNGSDAPSLSFRCFFQMGWGNRCSVLNLSFSPFPNIEVRFQCFSSCLTADLHIKKYYLEGKLSEFLFKPVHSTCKAVRGGVLGYLHGNVHKLVLGERGWGKRSDCWSVDGAGRPGALGLGELSLGMAPAASFSVQPGVKKHGPYGVKPVRLNVILTLIFYLIQFYMDFRKIISY